MVRTARNTLPILSGLRHLSVAGCPRWIAIQRGFGCNHVWSLRAKVGQTYLA